MYQLNFDFKFTFVEKRQRGRFAGFSLYVSNTDVETNSNKELHTLL